MFLVAVSCNSRINAPVNSTGSKSVELTVSAAASMQDALQAVGEAYQESSNTSVSYNFGSSGTLQQQIEQGAPVDVFISAAQKQMDALEAKNLLLAGTRQDLLKNEVVLIVPRNANAPSGFQDLTGNIERFSLGQPESVPAGQYGKEVLTSLNLYEQIEPKTVFAKDVRQVLTYVETGNVDAGIVYATDALLSDQVKVVATAPEASHEPIIYPVAVLERTENPEAAKEFVQFLSGDRAQELFEEYGFKMAP